MEGLILWGSKLHVYRSHVNLTKLSGMAKSCYVRHSQFFFYIAWHRGDLAWWCGEVCTGPASAASGFFWHFRANFSAHREPFHWLQWVWIRSEVSYLCEQ